jgi:5-formyltetrahydrofolate cyclo-ligase
MADQYKNAIRKTMKEVRANTSVDFQSTSSHKICNRIKSLEAYRKAKRIALYFAAHGEVDLNPLWNTAPLQGKLCFFPKIHDDLSLSFVPATPKSSFVSNRFGIEEPDVSINEAVSPEDLDIVIMPVVAFDPQCMRLGMGAGSYDRTLINQRKGLFIGVAYQFQCIDFISQQRWDVPLDAVVTERAIYWQKPLKKTKKSQQS